MFRRWFVAVAALLVLLAVMLLKPAPEPYPSPSAPDSTLAASQTDFSPTLPTEHPTEDDPDRAPVVPTVPSSELGTLVLDLITPEGPAVGATVTLFEASPIEEEDDGFGGWEEVDDDELQTDPISIVTTTSDGRATMAKISPGVTFVVETSFPWTFRKRVRVPPLEPGEMREIEPLELEWYGEIVGTVFDERGRAVPDAKVSVESADIGRLYGNADEDVLTDASGRFRLSKLRPGVERVVTAWGSGFLRSVSPAIPVEARREVEHSLELVPGERFDGRVEFEDGGAAEGVAVTVRPQGMSHHLPVESVSDHSGRYQLSGIPPGRLRVLAQLGGLTHTLEVEGASVLPDVIQIPRGGEVRVRIVDPDGHPVSEATVLAVPARSSWRTSAKTDRFGTALLANLLPQSHRLYVYCDRFESADGLVEVPLAETADVTIAITPIPDSRPVHLQLRTEDPDGNPIDGVSVTLWFTSHDGDSKRVKGETGRDGLLTLQNLEGDEFSLIFSKEGWMTEEEYLEIESDEEPSFTQAMIRESAIDIHVFVGEELQSDLTGHLLPAEFEFPSSDRDYEYEDLPMSVPVEEGHRLHQVPPGRHVLQVTTQGGAWMEREVDLEPGSKSREEFRFPEPFEVEVLVFSNGVPVTEGTVRLDLTGEPRTLAGEAIGQDVWESECEGGLFRVPVHFAGVYQIRYTLFRNRQKVQIERRIDGPTRIRLDHSSTSVSGRFVTSSGEPLSGTRVRISGERQWNSILDEEGRFEIPATQPGVHTWHLESAPAHLVPYGQFEVVSGGSEISIAVREGRSIEIVRLEDPMFYQRGWGARVHLRGRDVYIRWSRGSRIGVTVPWDAPTLQLYCERLKRAMELPITGTQERYEVRFEESGE